MKEQPEKRLFFGSDNRCLETGLRWSNIGVRTVHIAAASVVFGGVLLGTGFSSLHGWQRWVLASGLVLLALEWLHDRRWPHRGKGLLVQVHILCALAAYLWPGLGGLLLWAALVSGCIGSHMPRRFRHWSILDGWEKRDWPR